MDIFTHAVAITVLLFATGNAALIPFGVLGAVIIDIDVAYSFIARRDPSLYLLYHGGINHSIFGGTILSVLGFGATLVLSSSGLLPGPMQGAIAFPAFVAVLAGAYLHLFLDYLAAPGLPLLYPLTEKRFGLSLFPMPLYVLITVLSLASLGYMFVWGLTPGLAGDIRGDLYRYHRHQPGNEMVRVSKDSRKILSELPFLSVDRDTGRGCILLCRRV